MEQVLYRRRIIMNKKDFKELLHSLSDIPEIVKEHDEWQKDKEFNEVECEAYAKYLKEKAAIIKRKQEYEKIDSLFIEAMVEELKEDRPEKMKDYIKLRKQIDKGLLTLWTFEENKKEFTQIYKIYSDDLKIYTPQQLLDKINIENK